VKESQPKLEMIGLIKRGRDDESPLINLFDVDYKATEEDIRKLYQDVQIENIDMIKPGLFLLELEKDEALKLVEAGPKAVFNRPFFMKLGYSNKKQNPEEQWHTVNSERHKREVGHREDRPRRGGNQNQYNRRDQNTFEDDSGNQRRPFIKGPRENQNQDPTQIDTDNKFFKGHDLTSNEFKIKFTKSASTKKDDDVQETNLPKPSKPNPFGDAKPRDETEYLRKREDEKEQIKDLREHFEEKKDQIRKEAKNLPTPVNSPNVEFIEEMEKKNEATNQQKAKEGEKRPPGISNKAKNDPKKPGSTEQEAGAPESSQTDKQQGHDQAKQGSGPNPKVQPKGGDKPQKSKDAGAKFNRFDLLG